MAWYRDHLGLEPLRLEEWRAGSVPFLSMRIGETSIIDLVEAPRTGENIDHVSLWVEGPLHEVVASGSFDVVREPFEIFGAQGVGLGMYVRDPDANLIELKTYDTT